MMNTAIATTALNTATILTMSSREIAELVKSNHSDVKRSAKRLEADGLLTQPLAEFPFIHNGNQYCEYQFNKRDSLVLVARLSPAFTAAVIDRWQELEAGSSLQTPKTYIEALERLVETEKQKLALADDVNRLQKTCNTLADQFAIGMTPCQFARQLNGVNIKQVNEALYKLNWLFKQGSDWMVAAYARDKYLKQEMGEIKIREGVTRVCPKATLTKKGAKAIYKMYVDGKLPMKSDWDGHQTHILFSDVA